MKRLFNKFAPVLALVAIAALVFAVIRGRKTGDIMAQIKALFMPTVFFAVVMFSIFHPAESGLLMFAVVWGAVGASTTGQFSFNFVPQFIEFIAATAPTSVQVNVNGDGMVFNLDSTAGGLAAMTHIRAYQRQANSYMFQLADGLLNNKNGSVTIVTGVSAVTVRAWSPNKTGSFYCTFNPAAALANQAYNLNNFAYASFPNAAAADAFQLSYNDGSLDNLTREELNVYLGYFQNDTVTTAKYSCDNIAPARISQLTFTPAAAQTFYVMKYQAAYGGVINANPNV